MTAGLAFFTVCFPSILSIVDPLGAVPLYLAFLGDTELSERKRIAMRAAIAATVVLALFAATGTMIFHFFGITIPAFKVAGGILLFTTALEMMRAKRSAVKNTPEETTEAQVKDDIAIVPIAIPLLSGPAAIATAIMWAARAKSYEERGALYLSILLVGGLSFLSLLSAARIASFLGKTGINVITRIMGLILAATAAQFVIDGWKDAMHP